MSALTFTLLFFLCVCCCIIKVNGIQNLRYPTRLENNQWRFGKRQDLLSQPRFFLWKPALTPGQMYPNAKTPVVPFNYNRYGLPPAMAPIHQSYMFAIPTKVNYPPYQPVKEIDEKRKPGNLHHITIINAIIPKSYMPTTPTYTHPTTTFRNYRNNKLLYHQYFNNNHNNNNYGRQNMEKNMNKINTQQQHKLKLQQQKQQQRQQQQSALYPNSIPAATLDLMVNKPTMEYMNLISYTTSNNHENKINNSTKTQCGRKAKDDSTSSASNVLYYYCNNRILNYKNPSEYHMEPTQLITTTTPKPSTTTTTKSSRSDFYTTEKTVFLPTPNTPAESSFVAAITTTTTRKPYENEYNFIPTIATYTTKYDDAKPQQQSFTSTKTVDTKRQQQRHTTSTYHDSKLQEQRQITTKYDDIKRQPQQQLYTTVAYDNMKLHSFFTIEDAVTSAPQMQVFNDPYQAYRHARKHHVNHQRQTTTTTTMKPIDTTTTKKTILKSFFDDLEDEDYITSEARQYDYSFFGQPQKSVYHKPEIKNNLKLLTRNQIADHTRKPELEDSLFGESYQGKPKIKEQHFGIFDAIAPTDITTFKPNDKSLTTPKNTSKPLAYTTTTEMRLRNEDLETTTPGPFSDFRISTTLATTTTTEKKAMKISMKSPLNLRSTATYKYPKQRGFYKPFKNLTTSSSTSSTAKPPQKKPVKYQRQYKSKKLKQFKHLYTTTSTSPPTTTTTTSTTTAPTTHENQTKRVPFRTFPTTSTTEATTTRKIVSRTSPTTEATNTRKASTRFSSTTEANNAKKVLSRTSSTTESTAAKKQSTRRGSKRANKPKQKEEEPAASTTKRTQNKSRRRPHITSTTPKSSSVFTPTTSTYSYSSSSTPLQTSRRPTTTTTTTTTTTMKSIMRIANSKSRSKVQNDIKPYFKASNEVYDDFSPSADRMSLKSLTSSMAKDVSVPPLPIEIYFKKSHNAKI